MLHIVDKPAATEETALPLLLQAMQSLLWIKTPDDARRIAADLVTDLGGSVVPASSGTDDTLPLDISFGCGEPLLPSAPPVSVSRMLLERHLPSFVESGRRAIELVSRVDRLAENASIDVLTSLPNRRMLGRSLGRLGFGDTVIMIDLDHFKEVNDSLGHAAGDAVLRILGQTLLATARGRDAVGRYGGEEFVVILDEATDPNAFLDRLRQDWEMRRPHRVTFSAGIAPVGPDPSAALPAADRAMYRAKNAGRNQWAWASESDYSPRADDPDESPVPIRRPETEREPGFVAFSLLEVPAGGRDQLDAAFRDRLGAVDSWPGFRSIEVWADLADPSSYAMTSWWDTPEAFRAYMQSDDHRRSHDRIPAGETRPRPRQFRRFRVVAR